MTPNQTEFFARLCAEFPPEALFRKTTGGQVLTYLKAPTIMCRLDDVAGCDGWSVEYTPTARGFICKLGILVPTGEADTRVWLYKEDAGGFEGMTKTVGKEKVEDADNDEKSAATNAFRRAAHVWGIGRYLWNAGSPEYLGTQSAPETAEVEPAPGRQAPARQAPAPARQAPGRQAPQRGGGGDRQYDNFQVPRSGRALYAWACEIGKHFKCDKGVVKIMDGLAKERGYEGKYVDFDEVQVADVAWGAIEEIMTWPAYNGEFDHVEMPECLGNP